MEKVNTFREPVGAAGFCAIWQRKWRGWYKKKAAELKIDT
jgi:hypothetical protein